MYLNFDLWIWHYTSPPTLAKVLTRWWQDNDDDENYLSTNRSRCVDNDHSKGRNECKMQLLWEPSTVASNALKLWWLLWWWWWCKWRWRCFDDDDEPAMHNKHHGVYEDEWENLNNWKIRLLGKKTHSKSYARGSPVSHSTSTRGVWSAWQVWKVLSFFCAFHWD